MDIRTIYNQIELKKQEKNKPTDEMDWKPQRCEDYVLPPFCIPSVRSKKSTERKLSQVLAFIGTVKKIRCANGCTIMPIATTSRKMIAITGSQQNSTNLIKFMTSIGLISEEDSTYQFNARYKKNNRSKTYRYYYENECNIIEYCNENSIKPFTVTNRKRRKANSPSFPASLGTRASDVRFSSMLRLCKPSDLSKSAFEDALYEQLYLNYPELAHYQELADKINEMYYQDYPEFQIRFTPRFTWDKSSEYVRKIGIRATNSCVSAKTDDDYNPDFHGINKSDVLKEHNLTLSKDVKSSVPRITLSLNQGKWVQENVDIYEMIYQGYVAQKADAEEMKFGELRPAIKALHMRRYFDDEKQLRNHTCLAMQTVKNRQEVYDEMKLYRNAIVKAEGRTFYGNEIFLHESCIYLDVLKELLDDGYFVWECYDAFYARKDGVTQEEYEKYVTELVEEKANDYIARYGAYQEGQNGFSDIPA